MIELYMSLTVVQLARCTMILPRYLAHFGPEAIFDEAALAAFRGRVRRSGKSVLPLRIAR